MGWFRWSPANHLQTILDKVHNWWRSFENNADGIVEIDVKVKFILFGDNSLALHRYRAKHGDKLPSTVGVTWIGCGHDPTKAEFEIWLPFNAVKNGRFLNEWGLGHEMCHVLQWMSNKGLIEGPKFKNPDDAVKKDFY